MRRPRPQLQISLFPFLSVLLCTLGSLILLLFVLDQRARRSKGEEAAALARAARSARAAERERLESDLQARLDQLRSRRDHLAGQARARASSQDETERTLAQRQAELAALQRALDAELSKSNELVRAIGGSEQRTQAANRKLDEAKQEQTRLLEQLRAMELLVQRTREAVQQRRPLYSLVPYRGKHGTGRQPLYAECVRGELVFRPGETRLTLAEASAPGKLQSEVTQRLAVLPRRTEDDKPYVLLLIRPSGLSLYYTVVRALAKTDIQIGYEFIDEDWAIDFSAAASSAIASQAEDVKRPASWPGTAGPGGTGTGHSSGGTPGGGAADRPGYAGSGGSGPPGNRRAAGTGVALVPGTGTDRVGSTNSTPRGTPGGVTLLPPPARGTGTGSNSPGGPEQGKSGNRSAKSPDDNTDSKSHEGEETQQGEPCPKPPKPVRGGGAGDEESGQPASNRPRPLGGPQNHEWLIVVICTADHVALEYPPVRFELGQLMGQDNTLLTKVRDLLEHKRQRHPEVRPQLKFVIRRDGLRSYYAAAGALEALRLPTKWEIEKP